LLGRLEVGAEDVLARLEPLHFQETGDVEQDTPGNQTGREEVDGVGGRALGRHGRGRGSVVERAVVDDVAEGVDVRVAVVVVVGAHEVLRELQPFDAAVTGGRHVVHRGLGVVLGGLRVHRQA
jgi:hypothetical protein